MNKIIDELNELKKSIEEAKTQIAVLNDRKEGALKRLKGEFGLASVELAQKWLAKAEKELKKSEEDIQKRFKVLKENYEW